MKARKFNVIEKIIWTLYFVMFPRDKELYSEVVDAMSTGIYIY